MSKYKVAIIGTGRMAGLMEDEQPYTNRYSKPYSHFASYAAIEETEVVAVANRSPERMKAFCDRWDFHNTYLDYKKMIEVEKPDIVSVTTPTFARAEPIIFAAEHGVKGIYAEKGLCSSLAEADRIQEACNSNGVAFNWGAARRQHSGYIQVAEAIAKGGIGKPTHAVVFTFTDLIKHHPHTLDTVSMMLGDPKPVWVEGRLVEKEDPLDATKSRMGAQVRAGAVSAPATSQPRVRSRRAQVRTAGGPGDSGPAGGLLPRRVRERRRGSLHSRPLRVEHRGPRHRGLRRIVGQWWNQLRPARGHVRRRRRPADLPAHRREPHSQHDPGHHQGDRDRPTHQGQHRHYDADRGGPVRHRTLPPPGRGPRRAAGQRPLPA